MPLLFLLLWFFSLTAEPHWVKPPSLDEESWQSALPHLIPADHPVKAKLDSLFQRKHHNASMKAMEKGGFICIPLRNWDNIVVAIHPLLKGYIIKTYLDDQIGVTELYELLKRIYGAIAIQQAIQDFHFEEHFKVPQKWLYALPDSSPDQKHFLLVVEDMDLVSYDTNVKKWYKKITKKHLKELFTLINHVGLRDSACITNVPFAKDGKIAFVDTEHYHWWPIPFHWLTPSLNPLMQEYWQHLIQTNGQ